MILFEILACETVRELIQQMAMAAVSESQEAKAQQLASEQSTNFACNLMEYVMTFQVKEPQRAKAIPTTQETSRDRILCRPGTTAPNFRIRKESKQPRHIEQEHPVPRMTRQKFKDVGLVRLEQTMEEPEPQIDYLRRHKAKADQIIKLMFQEEEKRLQTVVSTTSKAPKNAKFTTDYNGTKIFLRKKKEDGKAELFGRVFITDRVVEPKLKTIMDSTQLINYQKDHNQGLDSIHNEPNEPRLPLSEIVRNLQLSQGVSLESQLDKTKIAKQAIQAKVQETVRRRSTVIVSQPPVLKTSREGFRTRRLR